MANGWVEVDLDDPDLLADLGMQNTELADDAARQFCDDLVAKGGTVPLGLERMIAARIERRLNDAAARAIESVRYRLAGGFLH